MIRLFRILLPLAILAIGVFDARITLAHQDNPNMVKFRHAYAFATTPAQKNGAVFLEMKNLHPEIDATFVEAKTDVAESIEIHEMVMDGDKMQMRRVEDFTIPAGEQEVIILEPHGLHIMLMGLKKPLKEGDIFPLYLSFDNSEIIKIEVLVAKPGMKPDFGDEDHVHADGTEHGHEHNHEQEDGQSDDHSDHSHH